MINQFKAEYAFLSNFYSSPIVYKGILYPTVEHAYVASKTNDVNLKLDISYTLSAGVVKKLGRDVQLIPNWDNIKFEIMRELLILKFSIPVLKDRLIATGDRVLIEGNWWGDKVWGVCLKTQEGENNLGKLLMDVRGTLTMSVDNSGEVV